MSLPYENATSGDKAYADLQKVLTVFGCDAFGMMTNTSEGFTLVQFTHRDRTIQLKASWKGYASAWLRKNPYSFRMRRTREEHSALALEKGKIAVPSLLRDWVKAQVTAIEIGMMPFEEAFMSQMLLPNGNRLIDQVISQYLLEGPKQ